VISITFFFYFEVFKLQRKLVINKKELDHVRANLEDRKLK
jgi:hypothetical protein